MERLLVMAAGFPNSIITVAGWKSDTKWVGKVGWFTLGIGEDIPADHRQALVPKMKAVAEQATRFLERIFKPQHSYVVITNTQPDNPITGGPSGGQALPHYFTLKMGLVNVPSFVHEWAHRWYLNLNKDDKKRLEKAHRNRVQQMLDELPQGSGIDANTMLALENTPTFRRLAERANERVQKAFVQNARFRFKEGVHDLLGKMPYPDVFQDDQSLLHFLSLLPQNYIFYTRLKQDVRLDQGEGRGELKAGDKAKVLLGKDESFIEPMDTSLNYAKVPKSQLGQLVEVDEDTLGRNPPYITEAYQKYLEMRRKGPYKHLAYGPEAKQALQDLVKKALLDVVWVTDATKETQAEISQMINEYGFDTAFNTFANLLRRKRDLDYIWTYMTTKRPLKLLLDKILVALKSSNFSKTLKESAPLLNSKEGNDIRLILHSPETSPSVYALANEDEFWAESVAHFDALPRDMKKAVVEVASLQ